MLEVHSQETLNQVHSLQKHFEQSHKSMHLKISILGIHIHKLVWTSTSIEWSFWIKFPWTERPSFKSPSFVQACVNPTTTTPSPYIPPFCICLYILNASIGIPLFANPLIIVVQQTISLLSVLSNTTIHCSTPNFLPRFQIQQPRTCHEGHHESQDIVISSNIFQDHLTK